jgi:hypothetical protein
MRCMLASRILRWLDGGIKARALASKKKHA